MPELKNRWLVTCSCGWGREASSEWAATAIAQLHERLLAVPGTAHTITIEAPASHDAGPQPELPLGSN